VLTRQGRLDGMTVTVERRPEASPETADTAGAELARLVKATIGVSVAVDVRAPGSIERSMGKMRRIVDQRRH
jgi:phenylacetate-CoA ligase